MLFLLSGAFLDPIIRSFAVERLKKLTDGELLQFIPQLTQSLKLEPYLFNPLAEFLVVSHQFVVIIPFLFRLSVAPFRMAVCKPLLMRACELQDRALRNRHRLGHSFFWALKAEMHIPKIVGRYGENYAAYSLEGFLGYFSISFALCLSAAQERTH